MAKDEEELRRGVKRAIQYIKIARKTDYVTSHALIDSDNFINEVVRPLEKYCEWGEEDEKEVEALAVKFKKETEAKTLKEKSEQLNKILKIGAVGLGVGAIGLIANHFFKRANGNTERE